MVNNHEMNARMDRLRSSGHGDLPRQATSALEGLQKQLAIVTLSIPLEDELQDRIDEQLKYLAMEDGYTLNGIARLFVDCQKRMAADWVEIGGLRRRVKEADLVLAAFAERHPFDRCSCGHRREGHHVWGRCHAAGCKCTLFIHDGANAEGNQ